MTYGLPGYIEKKLRKRLSRLKPEISKEKLNTKNMKKVNKVLNVITISIISIATIGIAGTYLSDYLISINWFGDYRGVKSGWTGSHDHWGARHYWYNWGLSFLFLTAWARAIAQIWAIIEDKA